jgi:hypothetical protein
MDNEADQFTTVSDIAYGAVTSPCIMIANNDEDDNNEGGVALSCDWHSHRHCTGEERHRRRQQRQQRRGHHPCIHH